MKTILISRCSTNDKLQDISRQTNELTNKYQNQYDIVNVFEYYQSGTKNELKNKEILEYCIVNNIEHIIVSEISRISRKVINVLQFIEKCSNHKINVIINNFNLHSLNIDKSVNQMTYTMISIGATFANVELNTTRDRLQSGRNNYINRGGVLGRKVGSKEDVNMFLSKHKDIVKYIKQKQSVRNIMKLTNKSNGTIQKVKKLID